LWQKRMWRNLAPSVFQFSWPFQPPQATCAPPDDVRLRHGSSMAVRHHTQRRLCESHPSNRPACIPTRRKPAFRCVGPFPDKAVQSPRPMPRLPSVCRLEPLVQRPALQKADRPHDGAQLQGGTQQGTHQPWRFFLCSDQAGGDALFRSNRLVELTFPCQVETGPGQILPPGFERKLNRLPMAAVPPSSVQKEGPTALFSLDSMLKKAGIKVPR
jgi:hypothetical protein